jgi:hypothetical protein
MQLHTRTRSDAIHSAQSIQAPRNAVRCATEQEDRHSRFSIKILMSDVELPVSTRIVGLGLAAPTMYEVKVNSVQRGVVVV